MNKKKNNVFKWGISLFLSTICLINEAPSTIVEATKGVSHIGTFDGSTTFKTSSSNGVNPGLFIEVMDEYGNLTQYESEDGVITISDTKEGAYITQAKLLGKTKYKDIDSGEILDNWEEGRNLELVSVENPNLVANNKNLIDLNSVSIIPHNGATYKKENDALIIETDGTVLFQQIRLETDVFKNIIGEQVTLSCDIESSNPNAYPVVQFQMKLGDGTFRYDGVFYGEGSSKTITIPSDTQEIKLQLIGNNVRETGGSNTLTVRNLQLEYGEKVTEYEKGLSNEVNFGESLVLRSIGEVRDELDLMTGKLTQRIGEVVLDGSDDEQYFANQGIYFIYNIETKKNADSKSFISNNNDKEFQIQTRPNGTGFNFTFSDKTITQVDVLKSYLSLNPLTIQYHLAKDSIDEIGLTNTYTFPPVKGQSVAVNGAVLTTIGSITVPTESLSFTLDPNLEAGQQFIAPEFEITNDNHAPITLGVKSFIQTTDVLNDVSPDKYSSWEGLNKIESKDIALALIPKSSDNWISLTEKPYYVANTVNETIGQIKGNSSVEFSFEALHGQAFDKTLRPEYQLTFVFEF